LSEVLVKRAALRVAQADGRGVEELRVGDIRRGLNTARTVGSFIQRWVALSDREGSRLTVTRYIELSGAADRTAWGNIAAFRSLFGDLVGPDGTPDDLGQFRTDLARAEDDVTLRSLIGAA